MHCDGVFDAGEGRGEGGGRLYRCCGELVAPAGFEGLETTLEFFGYAVDGQGRSGDSVTVWTGEDKAGWRSDAAGEGAAVWEGVEGVCRLLTMKVCLCLREGAEATDRHSNTFLKEG
jgi:hypothetical protein